MQERNEQEMKETEARGKLRLSISDGVRWCGHRLCLCRTISIQCKAQAAVEAIDLQMQELQQQESRASIAP